MANGFERFNRRIQLESIIKGLLISISFTLLSVGCPLLILKLLKIVIPFWIYIIIGISAFSISFSVYYFLLRPNKMKVAKRIDNELDLNERVQTMVEYEGVDGFMLDIQREDTNSRLNKADKKAVKIRLHYAYFIALAISLAVSITSFVLPVKAIEDPDDDIIDKDYEDDPYTIQRLKELIDFVKNSNCTASFKSSTITNLENLITKIKAATVESEMKSAVDECFKVLASDLEVSNSHKLIYDYALNKYKDANSIYLGGALRDLKPESIPVLVEAMKNQVAASYDIALESMNNAKIAFMDGLMTSPLANSYKNDELYKAVVDYGATCYNLTVDITNGSLDIAKAKDSLDKSGKLIADTMLMQKANIETKNYLELEIKTLFNLLEEDLKPDTKPTQPDIPSIDETTDDNKGDNGGGMGDGDIIFAADDLFYDPILGYVEYGKVLNAYRAQIEKDVVEGTLTPEMIEFYREYYKNLTEKEENKEA